MWLIPGDPEVPCRVNHFHVVFKTPKMTLDMDTVGRGPTIRVWIYGLDAVLQGHPKNKIVRNEDRGVAPIYELYRTLI